MNQLSPMKLIIHEAYISKLIYIKKFLIL